MPEYCFIENVSKECWDSFLNTFSDGNFEQSFVYNEVSKAAFSRTKSLRLAVTVDGNLVGLVQGMYSSYFGFGMCLRVMFGPVIEMDRNDRLQLAEELLNVLEKKAKAKRIIRIELFVPKRFELDDIMSKLGYSSTGKLNAYTVNLEKSVETLWKNISHNKRRNIKQATKKEVDVVQSRDIRDLHTFYSILGVTKKRRGFASYPLSWFEAVWNRIEPAECSKVFLARWNGKIVSGVFVVIHAKTVYALAAASLTEGWEARANDMMHWKIMEWACQNGYSKYHMGLIRDPLPTKDACNWGVWRWKREWNGDLDKIHLFDKLLLPKYRLVLKAKKFSEQILKKFK